MVALAHPLDAATGAAEMKQRLALALYRQMTGHPEVIWEDMNQGARGIALGLAEAALREMWEPSIPMLMAGRKQTFSDMVGEHCGPNTERTWQAMIDAALLDGTEGGRN
jgi:hypothetical protein